MWRARGFEGEQLSMRREKTMAVVVLTSSERIWNRHVPVVDVGVCRYHSVGREREIQKNAANSVRMWEGRLSPSCGWPQRKRRFLAWHCQSPSHTFFTSHIDKHAGCFTPHKLCVCPLLTRRSHARQHPACCTVALATLSITCDGNLFFLSKSSCHICLLTGQSWQ